MTSHGISNSANPRTGGGKKRQIQRQIEGTDGEIDELVYKLYAITEEERKVIEKEK